MSCVTTMKITDKKQLVKLLSYLVMGDGSIHKNGGSKNNVFSFSQVEDHKEFVDWAASVATNITGGNTYLQERDPPRRNVYKFQTRSHPFFNTLRDRIYIGNYKSIDPHALKLLDFEALSILYMSDGSLGRYVNPTGAVSYTTTLNLCRLSYGDLFLLKKALKERLDLEWNIVKTNRKYFTLRIRAKDHNKFMDGVSPFILDSFKYKIDFRTVDPS